MVSEPLRRLTILVPESDMQALEEAADSERLSKSALLRVILKRYLNEREK
jgi:Ribbon-helix-helix protein, copG family